MSWIQTYTGKKFDLLNPSLDAICIEDIAHALSNICRFTGHTDRFYSVAEHSVLVSRNVPSEFALEALMHDAAEAYIGDLSTPLKALLPEYRDIEKGIWAAISNKFDLPYRLHDQVKLHDAIALMSERRDLIPNPHGLRWVDELEALDTYPTHALCLSPEDAEQYFLDTFRILTDNRRVV